MTRPKVHGDTDTEYLELALMHNARMRAVLGLINQNNSMSATEIKAHLMTIAHALGEQAVGLMAMQRIRETRAGRKASNRRKPNGDTIPSGDTGDTGAGA